MPNHPPSVDCNRLHATLPVRELGAALDFYTTRLGFTLGFTWGDPPTFAGAKLGDVQIFLALDPDAIGSTTLQFVVGDADELYAFHRDGGIEILQPPTDQEYGVRDYAIRDSDGHVLVFGHPIYTAGPPVVIERVDVPVRLERRLAALLADLAENKRMSLSSCLEEILLHTSEPLGEGVASPHTSAQLRHIQWLKEKHGIDYDCHASYRFVEGPPAGT